MIRRLLAYYTDNIYAHRFLWAYIFIISWFSLCDIPASPVFGLSRPIQDLYLISVSALKSVVITLLLAWMGNRRALKPLKMIAILLFTVAATVNFISYKYYGFGISRRMISVFLETNSRETAEFLESMATEIFLPASLLKLLAAVAGMAVFFLTVWKTGKRLFSWITGIAAAAGAIAITVFSISFTSGRTAHSLLLRTAKYATETIRSRRELKQQLSMLEPFPENVSVESSHNAEDIIMIIGESASRGHLSAYGYPLPTSPVADSMADSLFLFTDAIGSSAGTSGNMERIMTFKTDDATYGDGYRYPLVIDFFKKAGYRTWWLSNQEKVGTVSNLSGVLNSRADVIRYVGAESSEDALLTRYDEALLPELANALADTASFRFICMHLLGSHVVYSHRYPSSYAKFSRQDILAMEKNRDRLTGEMAQTVAEYDNSIRYTDSIVGCVIRSVSMSERPAVVIYFSDHGENVYDNLDLPRRGPDTVEVPFIVYLNNAYRNRYPETAVQLSRATRYPFSTANVVHPLITLSGSRCDQLYDPSLDFLSPGFHPHVRYVDEIPWDKHIENKCL